MIKRAFEEDLSLLHQEKRIIKKRKDEEPLTRILVIGPNYPERCHFSENIYDLWKERKGYEVEIIGDLELPVSSIHTEKEHELSLSTVIKTLEGWKPQLTIIDQITINFLNDQIKPVFYHHRNYFRNPTVFYPTVVYFWHENILRYYKEKFTINWMAQTQYHDICYVPYNPERYQPQKKIYEGINGIGFREPPSFVYKIDDMFEIAPVKILEWEFNKFKKLGFNVFDTPVNDEDYRKYIAQCEAVWVRLSTRQYTSRFMVEAMGCKTLCVIKIENKYHEQILDKMGLHNGVHYIGVKRLEDIREAYENTTNKEDIIENAYNVVLNNHTYNNRIDQMIEKYEEITNKEKK